MKRNYNLLIITALLAIAPFILFAAKTADNPPPHPRETAGGPRPGDPPGGGTPVGAPIGSGTYILLTLAAAYAGRKVYIMRAAEEELA